ncbi:MAG: TauD/TfdA family dioxygenase [Candidatus Rokuibacteriota bacterium]
MILSNIIENGEPIGTTDAGQDWYTDMSYNETIGFLNMLYAVKVPRREGRVLGATVFVNTQAAYEGPGAGDEGAAADGEGDRPPSVHPEVASARIGRTPRDSLSPGDAPCHWPRP